MLPECLPSPSPPRKCTIVEDSVSLNHVMVFCLCLMKLSVVLTAKSRLSCFTGNMARCSPDVTLQYKQWTIPKNVL